MKKIRLALAMVLLSGTSAYGGQEIKVVAEETIPLCHIFAHDAAPSLLNQVIAEAMEETAKKCGSDSVFTSESVSINTIAGGCGALVAQVKGSCYKR